jgi:hypothetical protein
VVVKDKRSMPASAECVKSSNSTQGVLDVSMSSERVLRGNVRVEVAIVKSCSRGGKFCRLRETF